MLKASCRIYTRRLLPEREPSTPSAASLGGRQWANIESTTQSTGTQTIILEHHLIMQNNIIVLCRRANSAFGEVIVLLCVVRLVDVDTDLLISLNVPIKSTKQPLASQTTPARSLDPGATNMGRGCGHLLRSSPQGQISLSQPSIAEMFFCKVDFFLIVWYEILSSLCILLRVDLSWAMLCFVTCCILTEQLSCDTKYDSFISWHNYITTSFFHHYFLCSIWQASSKYRQSDSREVVNNSCIQLFKLIIVDFSRERR